MTTETQVSDKSIPRINIAEMTTDEIRNAITDLADVMESIRSKLSAAKAKCVATGQYADPDWYHRATTALRFKGVESRKLQDELGRRNREQRRKNAEGSNSRFEKAAKLLLPPEMFMKVAQLANSMSYSTEEQSE